jgi:hypothetical protein
MTYLKSILAAGAVAASLAGFTNTADAKVKFFLGIQPDYNDGYQGDGYQGDGYYGDDGGYGEERRYDRRYRRYDDRPARMSCRQVRRELRANGWRNVEAQDCEGRFYTFIAWRHGEAYEIRVRSRDARVVSRNPL